MKMQTNFKIKQDDDVIRTLIKDSERTVEEIGDLLLHRDFINSNLADLRERLQELNDEIESTKDEMVKDAKKQEDEFTEILNSGEYSILAREYRRLNREIYEGRKRGWMTYMEGSNYTSEGEIRLQRRDIGDKMLEAEIREFKIGAGRVLC